MQQRSFTEGSVPSHLIRLTGYMTLGMVSVMTASLVEAVYVGMVGTLELAALSFTFPLVMILQGVSMGVSVGASSVVARAMGAGERERGRLLTTHASMLVMILVVILGTAAWFALESFFSLLGAEPDVLAATVSYMQIWLLGLPCFAFAFVGSTLMRAAGDA
ncbi:MAG: MATE family efflux transporter, partial [Pseudomonadales bacterium]|nr:MATE family efflux transporter [Pseudomonadales bacterium]